MKKFILSALFLTSSVSAFAQQELSPTDFHNSEVIREGTRIGNCVVDAYQASGYGNKITNIAFRVTDGKNSVVTSFSDLGYKPVLTADPVSKTVVINFIKRSRAGGWGAGLWDMGDHATSEEFQIVNKLVGPNNYAISKLVIEHKTEGMFGRMKVLKENSIYCGR